MSRQQVIFPPRVGYTRFVRVRQVLAGEYYPRAEKKLQASPGTSLLPLPQDYQIPLATTAKSQVKTEVVKPVKNDVVINNKSQYLLKNHSQKSLQHTQKSSQPKWLVTLSVFFITLSSVVLIGLFAPAVYLTLFPGDPVPVSTAQSGTPLGGEFAVGTDLRSKVVPPYDETLPEGTWLIIPRIGVRTQILESTKAEDSLSKGVWRVPTYGLPGDITQPMILAAHRYGYTWWWKGNNDYWKYHSFYLLPELEPGDTVEVIADQRKYVYEVYAGEEGNEIRDYEADLILYTCKLLNSPVRHFRYARLLDPNKSTQPSEATILTSAQQ